MKKTRLRKLRSRSTAPLYTHPLSSIATRSRAPLRGLLFLTVLSLGSAFFYGCHWTGPFFGAASLWPPLAFLLCLLLFRCKSTTEGFFPQAFSVLVGNSGSINRLYRNDGTGDFDVTNIRTGTLPDNRESIGVALGDLNGNGKLDAFIANRDASLGTYWPNRIYYNEGGGSFRVEDIPTSPLSDSGPSSGVALGDLDGNGKLDAFVSNGGITLGINHIYYNKGGGNFDFVAIPESTKASDAVALGDLDGDGDLDAFVVNGYSLNEDSRIYVNNENDGSFRIVDLGNLAPANGIALGDLDGDGNLDAFVANGYNDEPNVVYINETVDFNITPASFDLEEADTSVANRKSIKVALGDLDGDGDLDAFVTNSGQMNRIYENDGKGNFRARDIDTSPLPDRSSRGVVLGDLDGDGDLDAFVTNTSHEANRVYTNDGKGNFRARDIDTSLLSGGNQSIGVALGQF